MSTIDIESKVEGPPATEPAAQSALAVRPPQSAPITPAQAKVEAIASLTMSAYARAATLQITPEEGKALAADFPDEAFKPGAAGKEHLLYIEHAFLRDRLTQVFGMGQWAIIPRNRWGEDFKTAKGVPATRIYVEAMLVVRGCFVGEAVGAMEYYPGNASQNYGDAVEGAKTAALRRCAKELGIGLQAWKKDWCDGWWARKRGGRDFSRRPAQNAPGRAGSTGGGSTPAQASKPAPTPKPATPAAANAPAAKTEPAPKCATEETRQWMIRELKDAHGLALEYFQKIGQLLPTEGLADLPLRFVPVSRAQMAMIQTRLSQFGNGERAEPAFAPNPEPLEGKAPRQAGGVAKAVTQTPAAATKAAIEVPRDANLDPNSPDAAWRSFPTPFGQQAGVKLADLDKKYLFGLWANFEPHETWEDGNGNTRDIKPAKLAKDRKFREMLDQAGLHYGFEKND